MAWIRTVPREEAQGLLGRIYAECLERSGKIWNIISLTSLGARSTQASLGLYAATMLSKAELSRAEREMVAVVVSRVNQCHY